MKHSGILVISVKDKGGWLLNVESEETGHIAVFLGSNNSIFQMEQVIDA